MKNTLVKHLNGKKILLIFLLTYSVYGVMVFITIPEVMKYSGGIAILDLMPGGYSTGYAKALFTALGVEGRQAYLYHQIPLDLIYPGLFALSSMLIVLFLLKRINNLDTPYYYLCFIPFVAGLADYAENGCIINLLLSFPELSNAVIEWANFFTIVKSVATTITFIVMVILVFIFIINKFKKSDPYQY